MGNQIQSNQRIAKNVLFMYFRMIIMLLLSLFTARVVFNTLGVSDYGLYNVVGGIIILMASINNTLTTGTQRFLTYAQGEGNVDKQKDVFATALLLHIIVALLFFIVCETAGLWFLHYKINIPEGRETAAFWVFQFSILSTMTNVIQTPYRASLIAHERMNIYAYMSIYDAVAKLLMIYLIKCILFDKLILYGALVLIVQLTSAFIYNMYCRYHFYECCLRPRFNRSIFKEMMGFTTWNVLGSMAVPFQNQGLNILLNLFFGTIVNAARGIAVRVNSMVMEFVHNFQVAVNPQIVKLYVAGEKEAMIKLVFNSSKISGFLYLIVSIPIFVEIEFILTIWLGHYPDYTISFVRIVLIQSLVQTLTRPVVMVVHAVGKMRDVNLTVGFVLFSALPISYILLKNGVDPVTIFAINLAPWFLVTFFELLFEKKYIDFPLWGFYIKVYGVVFPIALFLLLGTYFVHISLPFEGFGRFTVVCVISIIFSGVVIFYIGLSKQIRIELIAKAKKIIGGKLAH